MSDSERRGSPWLSLNAVMILGLTIVLTVVLRKVFIPAIGIGIYLAYVLLAERYLLNRPQRDRTVTSLIRSLKRRARKAQGVITSDHIQRLADHYQRLDKKRRELRKHLESVDIDQLKSSLADQIHRFTDDRAPRTKESDNMDRQSIEVLKRRVEWYEKASQQVSRMDRQVSLLENLFNLINDQTSLEAPDSDVTSLIDQALSDVEANNDLDDWLNANPPK